MMNSEQEFDLDDFHLKIVYAEEFPNPQYEHDLIEAAKEALATIEALRRRVAELEDKFKNAVTRTMELLKGFCEEHKETSFSEFQKIDGCVVCMHGMIDRLTTENAELKRQVEALREAVTAILEGEMPDYKSQEEFGGYVLDDSIREKAKSALREAAKGEVE